MPRPCPAILEKRGVQTRLLEVPGAPPVVFGEIDTPGAARTVVFYAHYDGQPLDPKEWATPPWQPVLRDGRIYARSASDDKAPIIAIATALDALHASGIPLRSNIKFVFEGEEEAGSPHLAGILAKYKDLLASDVWLICDGPVHQSRRQQIVFGARGITTLDITVYGPKHELHSGHYGNWAPNPAMMLARLLASMKDDDGRVHDRSFLRRHRAAERNRAPRHRRSAGCGPRPDARALARPHRRRRQEPGGAVERAVIEHPRHARARTGAQASNVIPATATATIDIRLVKGIDHEPPPQRVIEHIRKQGYFVVDQRSGRGYAHVPRQGGQGGGRAWRLQRGANVDGPADFATGAAHRRIARAARWSNCPPWAAACRST